MWRGGSWAVLPASLVSLGFGLACFNFTKPSALEHHVRVAAEHGWPHPSDAVLLLGILTVIAGSSVASWTIRGLLSRRK